MATEQTRMKSFLKELGELGKKHNISMGGCGCCGSPWMRCHSDDVPVEGYAQARFEMTYFSTDPDHDEDEPIEDYSSAEALLIF